MRRMAAGGAGRRRKPLSPKSVRNHIGTLSAMLGFARRRKWASSTPSRKSSLPSRPPSTAKAPQWRGFPRWAILGSNQ